MARRADDFGQRGVQLLGLSVDSVYSHLAWVDSIKRNFGVVIPFPVIADSDRRVADLYGMTAPGRDSATVRTVFFIDPEQTIRALLAYPAAIGRNIDELLRVFDALQAHVTSGGCAIPADWRPGQPTISPAPATMEGLQKRWQSPDLAVWYYQVNPPPA